MTDREFYNKVLATFEDSNTKEEDTILYKIVYSFTYALTRILLRFFGQKGINNEK